MKKHKLSQFILVSLAVFSLTVFGMPRASHAMDCNDCSWAKGGCIGRDASNSLLQTFCSTQCEQDTATTDRCRMPAPGFSRTIVISPTLFNSQRDPQTDAQTDLGANTQLRSQTTTQIYTQTESPRVHLELTVMDIHQYPAKIVHRLPQETITFGDMHGNALKLLHLLIANGILELEPSKYKKFKDDYYNLWLSDNALASLKSLADAKFPPNLPSLRFLGDLFADRGESDLFTMAILLMLEEKGVRFSIIDSNHDHELIAWKEHQDTLNSPLPRDLIQSLSHLEKLQRRGSVDPSYLDRFFELYSRHIRITEAARDAEGNPIIFTHAPVGTEEFDDVLELYDVPVPHWRDFKSVRNSIDVLNQKFKLDDFPFVYFTEDPIAFYRETILTQLAPRNRFVWVRGADTLTPFPSNVLRVHGHDGHFPSQGVGREIILDDMTGKAEIQFPENHSGFVGIVVTVEN